MVWNRFYLDGALSFLPMVFSESHLDSFARYLIRRLSAR